MRHSSKSRSAYCAYFDILILYSSHSLNSAGGLESPCLVSLFTSVILFPSFAPLSVHYVLYLMPTCTGSSKDSGTLCTCTSFVPRSPPKEGKCKVCGHRRSAHLDSTSGSSSSKYIERLLKNIEATAIHEEARKETIEGFRPHRPCSTVSLLSALVSTSPHLLDSCA